MRHFSAWHIIVLAASVAIMVGCVVYVAHRTAHWLGVLPAASYSIFLLFFLSIVGAIGSSWYVNGTKPVEHWAVIYGCYAAGVFLTLIFTMFAIDIVTIPFKNIPLMWKGVVTYGLTIVISLSCFVSAMHIGIDKVEVPIKGLKRQMHIIQLSDLHLGHFRGAECLREIVKEVNAQNPDIVVITGDIYESHYNLSEKVIGELLGVSAPIYYVAGNHDAYVNLLRVKDILKSAGVIVLDNQVEECKGIQIAGTGLEEVKDVINSMNIDATRPCIMLRHYPNGVDVALEHGVDLMLSGHTHGGQMFPITLINHFAFEYNKGLYKVGNGYIYTSNGTGTTGPPMRFGTKSVISSIKLIPMN